VAAFETDAEWYDIGTIGEHERACEDIQRNPELFGFEPLPPTEPELAPRLEAEAPGDGITVRRAAASHLH
jgi:hypothetical protein